MREQYGPDRREKEQPIKGRCTSVQCSHVSGGHCGQMMCANYRGDCPVH